ncbi:MAG: aldo/keto reductase [Acidilobaceae archaeon]
MSAIGLGFWQAGSRLWSSSMTIGDLVRALEVALETGLSLLDTAEVYGLGRSEEMLGEALRAVGREGFVVASKVAGFRVGERDVVRAVEAINKRLGSVVDVIQLHWPPPVWSDFCEPVRGLERAVAEGLAHYYGLSNFDAEEVERALECSKRIEPVSDQVQYSLAFRAPEARLKPLLDSRGLSLIAWSPLAKGALAGAKPTSLAQRLDPVFGEASRDEKLQRALESAASRLGATKAQVALAWLVAKGSIPIPGFRRSERVREIAGAALLDLSESVVRELDEASRRYLERWGSRVWSSRATRLAPALLQRVAIALLGGI